VISVSNNEQYDAKVNNIHTGNTDYTVFSGTKRHSQDEAPELKVTETGMITV
jgi:hypothetical protein